MTILLGTQVTYCLLYYKINWTSYSFLFVFCTKCAFNMKVAAFIDLCWGQFSFQFSCSPVELLPDSWEVQVFTDFPRALHRSRHQHFAPEHCHSHSFLLTGCNAELHYFHFLNEMNYISFYLFHYIWKHEKKYRLETAHAKNLEMQTHQGFWARENPNNPISSASCFRVLLKLFTV